MSMSYNDPGERMMPLVETFQYHDTFGPPMTSDMPPVLPVQNNDNNNDEEKTVVPVRPVHISQPDMTPLVAEAHARGLELGIRQATARFEEELAQERKRVADLIHGFQGQCSDYYAKVELDLVNLALAISAKILHRESQVDPMVVAGLVKVMLERLKQKTTVIVRIRPEDAGSWRQYFRDSANVQIVEDSSLDPKACFLETELGVADMGLESQLKEVEQGFFDLLARRPEAK
jgi:flagellar biosynthesis/type III secretory pathway protein FliH